MNMHGFIAPAGSALETEYRSPLQRIGGWAKARRAFLTVVILPTLIVAGYYYLVAADQYRSEAHFVVRSAEGGSPVTGGLGQMLGVVGGLSTSQSDAMSVSDYLMSHEAVQKLRQQVGLVQRFQRPEADALAVLRPANPTPERLLKYYNSMVNVHFDRDTAISTLTVRSFRARDSFEIIQALLSLSEQRVNEINRRSYQDAVRSARLQLVESENAVAAIQRRITAFRQVRRDIDPAGSGEAQIGLVSTMTGSLAAARAQLDAMRGAVDANSPQYVALRAHVASMERQLARQSGRLTGGDSTIAYNLGDYEDLKVRQDFVAKRYEAAAANLEKAREQASRQQLYVARIVDPNMPVKSEYPERGKNTLLVFAALLIVYAIGWLLAAGVKEHAA